MPEALQIALYCVFAGGWLAVLVYALSRKGGVEPGDSERISGDW